MPDDGEAARFEKLKGRENFDTWRINAKSYLVIKKVWKCFTTQLATNATAEQLEKDELAWSELSLLLDKSILSYIADTTTAKQAWESLVKSFEDSSLSRKVELLKQMVQLKLSDCESTEEYVNKMQMTSMKVKKAGLNIDDELVASFMLAGLPEELSPLVMAVENSTAKLTTDGVKTLLLQENRLSSSGSSGSAFFSKSRIRPQSFKFRCHKCGDIGHMAKHCMKNELSGEQGGYSRSNQWKNRRYGDPSGTDDAL